MDKASEIIIKIFNRNKFYDYLVQLTPYKIIAEVVIDQYTSNYHKHKYKQNLYRILTEVKHAIFNKVADANRLITKAEINKYNSDEAYQNWRTAKIDKPTNKKLHKTLHQCYMKYMDQSEIYFTEFDYMIHVIHKLKQFYGHEIIKLFMIS